METHLLEPLASGDWNAAKARHLLNRAGFGIPRELIGRLAAMTPAEAVAHLVEHDRIGETVRPPDFLPPPQDPRKLRREFADLDEDARRKKRQELRRAEREAVERLKAWWLELMYTTRCPLREKMVLFWHGHFATSAQKVQPAHFNYHLNEVFRRHATGNFKALTTAVGQSPAMLRYLDNARSTKRKPNENWARELMELFTLGQGHYTERDIKEAARAFTGWSADYRGFRLREDTHDFGPKTFMGRTGNFDGGDIIDIIFEQPAAAEFICAKLWTFFAHEAPPDGVVQGLAQTLRENGYELRPVLRRLFLARAFYGSQAMGTQVKSPVQFTLQLAHDLGAESPPYNQMARATAQLGQNLFYPPNVKGWDGNRAWINANTLLLRYNMPGAFVSAVNGKERRMMSEAEKLDAPTGAPATTAMRAGAQAEMQPENQAPAPRPWNPARVLRGLSFSTADGLVESLERHFLAVPLDAQQRQVLLEALGTGTAADAPWRPADLRPGALRPVLHLLLSTGEYQLC
jgi:uncharacterized protein (DUF1800 family)